MMEGEFKKTPRSGQAVLAVLEGYPKTRGPGGVAIDHNSAHMASNGVMAKKGGHLPPGASIVPKAPVPPNLHPAMLATVQNAGVIPQGGAVPPVAPAVLAAAPPPPPIAPVLNPPAGIPEPPPVDASALGGVDPFGAPMAATGLDPVMAAYLGGAGAGDIKLTPGIPEQIAGAPSPIVAAMMTPVTDGLVPGCELQVTAMELLQQAVADPSGAAALINAMMGEGTCDETSVQPKAMQITMLQAYNFASKLAQNMGYYSLEHYELHKQALIRASGTKKRHTGEKRLTLFIGGLKKETTDATLLAHFSQYGETTRCDIIRNSDGTSRGFGFVKYKTEEEIMKAVRAKFDHILDGQWVNVKVSDPNRAETGKNASKAVEMAARSAGVAPENYMDYLQELAQAKYGYANDGMNEVDRSAPY